MNRQCDRTKDVKELIQINVSRIYCKKLEHTSTGSEF